jgi:hypothetical protein
MKRKFEQEPCLTRPLCNVRVTAIGLFQGPSEGPYGHLDGYKFRFKIMRIEASSPLQRQTKHPILKNLPALFRFGNATLA